MGLILQPALGLLRRVPLWAWALVAALAWGGFQRHQTKAVAAEFSEAQADAAHERESALQASITETARRLTAQQEIAHAADQAASQAQADATAAASAAQRLRQRIAALQASPGAKHPATALDFQAAADRASVYADLFKRADERAGVLAAIADDRSARGRRCEQSYESLTP